jgi:hypothetical protein
MKRPSFGDMFSFRDEEPAVVVPSRTLARRTSQPLPASLPVERARPRVPSVAMPPMRLVKNPPFKQPNPAKPLSCKNGKTPSGRIHVVCV